MGINLGNDTLDDLKLGTQQVDAVYLGNELLWPTGPQPQPSVPGIEMNIENVGTLAEFDTDIIEGAYVDVQGGGRYRHRSARTTMVLS